MKGFVLPALLAVLLAACGGAPSESEIKESLLAYQKRGQEEAEAAARAMGGGFAGDIINQASAQSRVEIAAVHKVGCKEDGEKAYRCDVEIEASRGGGKPVKTPPASIRFVKGSDGWVAQQ